MSDWRDLFLGREKELSILKNAWGRAVAGEPQLLVLIAESGLGKTRLVQEFYSWLSNERDPENYWPDLLPAGSHNSMHINPSFPSGWKNVPIPWLWWGLRCQKPSSRNIAGNSTCALTAYLDKLVPHFEPIWTKRDKAKLKKTAFVFAAQKLSKIAASLFPGVSTVMTAYWLFKDVKTAADILKHEKENEKSLALGIQELQDEKVKEETNLVFTSIQSILDESDKLSPVVPVILVIDDAQWTDLVTIEFLQRLLKEAFQKKLKIIVVATHWEQEWNNHWESSNLVNFAGLVRSLKSTGFLPEHWAPIRLSLIQDLSGVIQNAFPGVSQSQRTFLLNKAGGNPFLLFLIVDWLLSRNDLFKDQSFNNELTLIAENTFKTRKFDIHSLIEERFYKLPEAVREALGWSSEQGIVFLENLTACLMERMGLGVGDCGFAGIKAALKQAQYPVAMTQAITSFMSEFRQIAFYEVAHGHVVDYKENQIRSEFQTAMREILIDWLFDRRDKCDLGELSPSEKETLLKLTIGLLDPNNREYDQARSQAWGMLLENYWVKSVYSETLIKTIFENNLEVLLNVRFLRSEHRLSRQTIDTLGIDEKGRPVIIEFKLDFHENAISQGFRYLDLLLANKDSIEKLVIDLLGGRGEVKIDWSMPRLIFIVANTNGNNNQTDKKIDQSFDLHLYRQYGEYLKALEVIYNPSMLPFIIKNNLC